MELHSFLSDCLTFSIAGFNDKWYSRFPRRAKWYPTFPRRELALVEVNDHQGNDTRGLPTACAPVTRIMLQHCTPPSEGGNKALLECNSQNTPVLVFFDINST